MHSGYVRLIIVLGIIYLRPDQNHDVKRIFGAVFIQITISFCRRHQTMIHIGSASFLAKRYEENMFCSIFMQQFFKKN